MGLENFLFLFFTQNHILVYINGHWGNLTYLNVSTRLKKHLFFKVGISFVNLKLFLSYFPEKNELKIVQMRERRKKIKVLSTACNLKE